MDRTTICVPGLVLLLVACLLVAGCSSSDGTNQTVQPNTTANGGPLYTAGDIVKTATAPESPAWLVVSYDSASDSYTRALIYKNADGTWGYRVNSKTETSQRAVMERVYTVKITHVTVASVPTAAPTTVTTVETTQTTVPATTVTTTALKAPNVTDIIPDVGYTGSNVSVQNLAGEYFVVGATARLSRDAVTIPAIEVRYISNKSLICKFIIPSDAAAGSWDVTVINPDGQSGTFTKIFTIHAGTNDATTTSPTGSGSVTVTTIDPPFIVSGVYREFIITGSGFQDTAKVKLIREGKPDIMGSPVRVMSTTEIRCFFNIPVGSTGPWDIVITNPDQTYGRLTGGLVVRG